MNFFLIQFVYTVLLSQWIADFLKLKYRIYIFSWHFRAAINTQPYFMRDIGGGNIPFHICMYIYFLWNICKNI